MHSFNKVQRRLTDHKFYLLNVQGRLNLLKPLETMIVRIEFSIMDINVEKWFECFQLIIKVNTISV